MNETDRLTFYNKLIKDIQAKPEYFKLDFSDKLTLIHSLRKITENLDESKLKLLNADMIVAEFRQRGDFKVRKIVDFARSFNENKFVSQYVDNKNIEMSRDQKLVFKEKVRNAIKRVKDIDTINSNDLDN